MKYQFIKSITTALLVILTIHVLHAQASYPTKWKLYNGQFIQMDVLSVVPIN